MPLLSVDHLSIAFGVEKLLDDASFQLDAGERVCLIGRNGAGKTTLLRLLAGEIQPDSGDIWRQPGLRVATLAQELPTDTTATVFEIVAGGLEGLGDLLADYHDAALRLAHDHAPEPMRWIEQLQHELEAREQPGKASFTLEQAELSGKLVIEAQNLSYAWQGEPLIRDFSMRIMRGDRIGLIGPNGSGKTSLLNLLLGRLPPGAGQVRHGTKLEIAYFDQLREPLDPEQTVLDSVAGGREILEINGQRRHVIGYLGDFLFTAQRARSPVKSLSGGERNRLLLARLFSQPANLLVMDEPTNDLDLETLELLEELLMDYTGTLLLVSHDRAFLDNVVTSCLVFEGDGRIREYVGGYSDWLRQRPAPEPVAVVAKPKPEPRPAARPPKPAASGKLGYNERRELERLPARIEELEQHQRELHALTADSAFYKQEPAVITRRMEELRTLEAELETAYGRWEELEAREGAG